VLDYLNLRLTDRFTSTFDSILTSWVTDNRNPNDIRYHDALIKSSGIDGDKFPEIVSCTTVLGNVKSEVAEALGLAADVKVVAGAIDNTAAAVGSGAVADFMPCALPDRYLLTALQATAGGNLKFLRDNILYHEDELLQEANVPDVFKIMDQIAARVPAGSHGVIYTPWIWGERAPVEDRNLRAGLYNISLNNNREDIIRAFLEGVAFNTRWLLKPVEKFIGRSVSQINLAGGGGNSDVWCQIFADVLNIEVRQVKDPIQVNARGAAFIAGVGLGSIVFGDVPQLVKFKHTYLPTPRALT
jgi:xylulokinase